MFARSSFAWALHLKALGILPFVRTTTHASNEATTLSADDSAQSIWETYCAGTRRSRMVTFA